MKPYKIHNMSNDNERWPEDGTLVVFTTKERFVNTGIYIKTDSGKPVFRVVSRFQTLDFTKDEVATWADARLLLCDYETLYNQFSYVENLIKNGEHDALTFRRLVMEGLHITKHEA